MNPGDPAPGAGSAPAALRQAAAEQLGLAADLDPAATRAALLRHLAAARFFPDAMDHEALLVLAGRPAGPTPLLLDRGTAAAAALREEVEAFAAAFFEISIAPRREAWGRLARAAAGDDRLRARLRQLEAGLGIEPAAIPVADPLVRRLATEATELLLMEPAARAAAARERVWALVGDPAIRARDRDRARRTLIRDLPAVAALSPGYFDQLAVADRAGGGGGWAAWVNRGRRRLADGLPRTRRGWATRLIWLVLAFGPFTLFGTKLLGRVFFGASPQVGSAAPGGRLDPDTDARLLLIGLRRRVRDEVARVGGQLDARQMERVVAAVPLGGTGLGADLRRAIRTGRWSDSQANSFAAGLRRGLADGRVDLTADQAEAVVRNIVATTVPPPAEARP